MGSTVSRIVTGRQGENGLVTQAVQAGGLVFTTGSIGNDLDNPSELPDDIETQTVNTLKRLQGILDRAGSSLEKVIKVTVYMDEIDSEFERMGAAYAGYLSEHGITEPPARTTIGCRLPWSKVEMDMIALA
jgi:2-iminobutanoate/2-iminopropanoate deaminase